MIKTHLRNCLDIDLKYDHQHDLHYNGWFILQVFFVIQEFRIKNTIVIISRQICQCLNYFWLTLLSQCKIISRDAGVTLASLPWLALSSRWSFSFAEKYLTSAPDFYGNKKYIQLFIYSTYSLTDDDRLIDTARLDIAILPFDLIDSIDTLWYWLSTLYSESATRLNSNFS